MKALGLLCVTFLFLLGCGTNNYESLDKVTGLDLFDINGLPVGRWNVPNHKRGDNSVFPVPSNGNVFVAASQHLTMIWVVAASCESDDKVELLELSQDLEFDLDEIKAAAILESEVQNAKNIALDLRSLAAGFYKVFFTLDNNELYWQNIFIDPSATNFPSFDFLQGYCD